MWRHGSYYIKHLKVYRNRYCCSNENCSKTRIKEHLAQQAKQATYEYALSFPHLYSYNPQQNPHYKLTSITFSCDIED